jgi:hypothetical protein
MEWKPSVIFRSATAQARNDSDLGEPARDAQVIELPRAPKRPPGARFGALVHATLAAVPLDGNADQVRQIAALYARVLGAEERETAAAAAAVQSALAHPLMVRARDALRWTRVTRKPCCTPLLVDRMGEIPSQVWSRTRRGISMALQTTAARHNAAADKGAESFSSWTATAKSYLL